MPEIGDRLSREGLCQHYAANFLGYALVDHSSRAVKAIAVTTKLNPDAPLVILPGYGPARESWTRAIERYTEPIEVWVMDDLQQSTEYEFSGLFRVVRVSREQAEISEHFRADDAGEELEIEAVIWLEEC